MTRSRALAFGFLAVISLLTAATAAADTFNGQIFLDPVGGLLATGNGGTFFPGPYAEIAIVTNGTGTAHVTFQADKTGNFQYFFISPDIVELVLSKTTLNIAATTASVTTSLAGCVGCSGFGNPAPFTVKVGNQQVDGIGTYNFVLDGANGFANAVTHIEFDLVLTSGTWGTANSVIVAASNFQPFLNSKTGVTAISNSWAGAHIATCNTVTNTSCTPAALGVVTGWAGGAVGNEVPEPGTLALLGSGLLVIGTIARRFRK